MSWDFTVLVLFGYVKRFVIRNIACILNSLIFHNIAICFHESQRSLFPFFLYKNFHSSLQIDSLFDKSLELPLITSSSTGTAKLLPHHYQKLHVKRVKFKKIDRDLLELSQAIYAGFVYIVDWFFQF